MEAMHHYFQMNNGNFRFHIKVRILLNIKGKLFLDGSYSVYDGQAPSYNTVTKWSKCFHKNCEEIEHDTCLIRSVTEKSSANIDEARRLADDNSYLTINEMEVETGMISGTIE
jgi:hypothetical protein